MATGSNLQIQPGELTQIVESVFANMLGLEVGACEAPWVPGGDRLTAAVELAGSCSGTVTLECDRRQAREFASRYLSMNLPDGDLPGSMDEVARDEVARDMVGELVNMIGGNLKCVLAPGVQLSLRSTVDGSGRRPRTGERLAYQCVEGVIWIAVMANPGEPR